MRSLPHHPTSRVVYRRVFVLFWLLSGFCKALIWALVYELLVSRVSSVYTCKLCVFSRFYFLACILRKNRNGNGLASMLRVSQEKVNTSKFGYQLILWNLHFSIYVRTL
jgi:hypothetical protein